MAAPAHRGGRAGRATRSAAAGWSPTPRPSRCSRSTAARGSSSRSSTTRTCGSRGFIPSACRSSSTTRPPATSARRRRPGAAPTATRHQRQHVVEQRGEDLRLAYVALTRAQHQAVVWWAGSWDSRDSALGRLLFARAADGTVAAAGAARRPTTRRDRPLRVARRGRAGLHQRRALRAAALPAALAQRRGRAPPASAAARSTASSTAAGGAPPTATSPRRRTRRAWPASPRRRSLADEPEPDPCGDEPRPSALPLGGDARRRRSSARSCTRVLEATDFAAARPRRRADRRPWRAALARRPVDVGAPAAVVAGLRAAIETPLGPLVGGLRLRDVARADRLDELVFELPLAGGDEPAGRVTPGAIGEVLRAHLAPDDPLAGYADRLDDPDLRASVRGYLTGSIDLVLRAGERVRGRRLQDELARRAGRGADAPRTIARRRWPPRCSARTTGCRRCSTRRRCTATCAGGCAGYDPERHLGRRAVPVRARDDGRAGSRRLRVAAAGRAGGGAERPARGGRVIATTRSTSGARCARAGLLREFNDAGVLAAADVHVAVAARRAGGRGGRGGRAGRRAGRPRAAARARVRGPGDDPRHRGGGRRRARRPVRAAVAGRRGLGAARGGQPARRGGGGRAREPAAAARRHRPVPGPLLARGAPGRRRPARARRRRARSTRRSSGMVWTGCSRADDERPAARPAATAVRRRFAVVAGGPGTGKTTTVARIVALLAEQAGAMPLVALAAPTGKAAARLEEAVHAEAGGLDVAPEVREGLLALSASTLHRLLGWRPGSHSRFRHHRGNRLPHDVVIVDETSMVSLSLMARLIEAVRPDAAARARGRPGAADLDRGGRGPGRHRRRRRAGRRRAGARLPLRRGHRRARLRDPRGRRRRRDRRARPPGTRMSPGSPSTPATPRRWTRWGRCARAPSPPARAVIDAARAGDAREAIEALGAFRRAVRAPARRARRRGLDGAHRGLARRPRSGAAAGTRAARCW